MKRSKATGPLSGEVLDERLKLSLRDPCDACGIHAELVVRMVEEGIVEPDGVEPTRWRFSGYSVTRVHRAFRLNRDPVSYTHLTLPTSG